MLRNIKVNRKYQQLTVVKANLVSEGLHMYICIAAFKKENRIVTI